MKEKLYLYYNRFIINMNIKYKYNKAVRILCYPLKKILSGCLRKRNYTQQDVDRLKQLKDTHLGERCVIVGNGPSLSVEDVENINCVSFASNNIVRMFDNTTWRPDYYMIIDSFALYNLRDTIPTIKNCKSVFLDIAAKKIVKKNEFTKYIYVHFPYLVDAFSDKQISVSDDISNHFGYCATVTGCLIQLAIYMGFKEIILLGIDHDYNVYYDKHNKIVTKQTENYFYNNSDKKYWNITVMHLLDTAYRLCQELAIKKNVKIYNATRRTKLNAFPRVDFDEILSRQVGTTSENGK